MSNSCSKQIEVVLAGDIPLFKAHTERTDEFDLAQAVGAAKLVFGDSIGIETAGKRQLDRRRSLEIHAGRSSAAQATEAGPAPMQAIFSVRCRVVFSGRLAPLL